MNTDFHECGAGVRENGSHGKMNFRNVIRTVRYESPCGELTLGAFGGRLCLCGWRTEKRRGNAAARLKRILRADFEEGASAVAEEAGRQLDEFFAGKRRNFSVPLLFVGTDFQKKVWNALLTIPCGETVSYGELARSIGLPSAVRAVAAANGANALSIFAPCHRVIGSDRSLTGYAGGLTAKRFLLELESRTEEDFFAGAFPRKTLAADL